MVYTCYGTILPARKGVTFLSKRWLAYMIVSLVGCALTSFGPGYGISEYVGLGILMLAFTILLFPQRPRKRRWLASGTFFVLGEMGFLLPAFWHSGMTPCISILLVIIGGLAAQSISSRAIVAEETNA
jgi:hypothetical protein